MRACERLLTVHGSAYEVPLIFHNNEMTHSAGSPSMLRQMRFSACHRVVELALSAPTKVRAPAQMVEPFYLALVEKGGVFGAAIAMPFTF